MAPTAPPEALCGHAGRQKRERTHTCVDLFEKYLVHSAAPGPGCTGGPDPGPGMEPAPCTRSTES